MVAIDLGSGCNTLEGFRVELDAFVEKIPLRFKDNDELETFRTKTRRQRLHLQAKAKEFCLDFHFELARSQQRVKEKLQQE